jgi:hypothetical protein
MHEFPRHLAQPVIQDAVYPPGDVFRKGTVKGMGNAARDAGMGADRYHNASLFPQDPFFTRA